MALLGVAGARMAETKLHQRWDVTVFSAVSPSLLLRLSVSKGLCGKKMFLVEPYYLQNAIVQFLFAFY